MPKYSYNYGCGLNIHEDARLAPYDNACNALRYTENGDALIWSILGNVFWRTNGRTTLAIERWNRHLTAFAAGHDRHVLATTSQASCKPGCVYMSFIGDSKYCLLTNQFGHVDELYMTDDSESIYASYGAVDSTTISMYDVQTGKIRSLVYSGVAVDVRSGRGTALWMSGRYTNDRLYAFDVRCEMLTDMGAIKQPGHAVTAINPAMGDVLIIQTEGGDNRRDTTVYDTRACAGYICDTVYSQRRVLPWLYIV